ncbi:SDR family oxidoreductase [Microvirga massiliensis]|uniref:SDR family oxidoreductase n=1 Tax=Microvirga massiliensis TaxID=1033741 RepID=UPI00062BBD2E|nr:SDR family oxidoreductase [Microvirga massiliensis]
MKRVCLLTGASGLLGRSLIERCSSDYWFIAVHNNSPVDFATQDQFFIDPLEPDRDIAMNDTAVFSIRANLASQDEVVRIVDEVVQTCGRVDLLVNAAARRDWSPLLTPGAVDSADQLLAVNLLAPLRLTIEVAKRCWLSDPYGNIRNSRNVVNIASSAGLFVYPDLGQALYATSKAALIHLTYHLASELWDLGVRVNGVAPNTFPGLVATDDVIDAVLDFDHGNKTGQIAKLLGNRA